MYNSRNVDKIESVKVRKYIRGVNKRDIMQESFCERD